MLPIETATLLAGAEAPRTRPVESAEAIACALQQAPHDLDVRLAAYRFYFYAHDYLKAAEQAKHVLAHAARRLNVNPDWRCVSAGDARFSEPVVAPGLYLQALIASGYCAARLGHPEDAREILAKAAELDPKDRFGGAWLLAKLDALEDDE